MSWLDKIKGVIAMKYIGSLVRTAVAALAGFLLTAGIDPAVVEKFSGSAEVVVSGLIAYAVAQFFSLKDKAKNQPGK